MILILYSIRHWYVIYILHHICAVTPIGCGLNLLLYLNLHLVEVGILLIHIYMKFYTKLKIKINYKIVN